MRRDTLDTFILSPDIGNAHTEEKRIAKGLVDFKSEEGIGTEVILSRFSIERYRDPFKFSPREKPFPRVWLVETDRKRDFYIPIQIGKQFVSLFENHKARNCACVPRECAPIQRSFAASWEHLSFCI